MTSQYASIRTGRVWEFVAEGRLTIGVVSISDTSAYLTVDHVGQNTIKQQLVIGEKVALRTTERAFEVKLLRLYDKEVEVIVSAYAL